MSTDRILELRRSFQGVQSLDSPLSDSDEDLYLSNIIPDETDFLEGVERRMTIKALREDLEISMDTLPNKEDRQMLKQCFAWYGGKPSNFKRIASIYKCSEGQARNRVQKALLTLNRSRKYLANEYIELLSTIARSTSMHIHGGEFSRNVTASTIEAVMKPGQTMNLIQRSKGDFITILKVETSYFEFVKVKNSGSELESVVDKLQYWDIKDYRTENGILVEIYI